MKKRFLYGGICLIIFLILTGITALIESRLYDQQAAKRWSDEGGYTQISCFYPLSMTTDDYYFQNLNHTIEQALLADSVTAENENAKLFVEAYSVTGSITLESETASMDVTAIGVTEEFFQFHPLSLLGGSYFYDGMLMQDGVLIDEDAAWQLFGSSDVVGMQIMIGNIPYYIMGVIDRQQGHFANAAGLEDSVCYVSVDTLQNMGIVAGSYTYECVLPNPVDNFGMQVITAALQDEDKQIQVVENSTRYHIMPLLQVFRNFGIRSMNIRGIVFPYWENQARAYEDVFAVLLVIRILLLLVVLVVLFLYLRVKWKNKTWTGKTVFHTVKNWIGTTVQNIGHKIRTGIKKKREKKL